MADDPSRSAPEKELGAFRECFTRFKFADVIVGEEIGRGRFKKVSKAILKPLQREVVVLRYSKGCDIRELELLVHLGAAEGGARFVPEVFGALTLRGETMVVQELALGGSLKAAISAGSPESPRWLTYEHLLSAAEQVARALGFLASVRIVHADMSCRNGLLCSAPEEPPDDTVVKICDFGLALALAPEEEFVNKRQAIAVRWSAPETVAWAKLSFASDVWSLGITLWELFVGGKSPWPLRQKRAEVSDLLRLLAETGRQDGAGVRVLDDFQLPDDVDDEMRFVIGACLEVSDKKRPCALDVAEAISRLRCLPEEEPSFLPPTVSYTGAAPSSPSSSRSGLRSRPGALRRASMAQRLSESEGARKFASWAVGKWDLLYEAFRPPSLAHGAFQPTVRITEDDFLRAVRSKGFRGDAAAAFAEVSRLEASSGPAFLGGSDGGEASVRRGHSLVCSRSYGTISIHQLKRWQALLEAVASADACADISAAGCFVRRLKEKRGSFVRGWRLEVERHEHGKVIFRDFADACSRMELHGQARIIWDSIRHDGSNTPLQLHDFLDPEVDDLQEFAATLDANFAGDPEAMWRWLDVNRQGFVAFGEFRAQLRNLGFSGNFRMMFRGLDSGGVGHMLRTDLKYALKVFGAFRETLRHGEDALRGLLLWAWANRLASPPSADAVAGVGSDGIVGKAIAAAGDATSTTGGASSGCCGNSGSNSSSSSKSGSGRGSMEDDCGAFFRALRLDETRSSSVEVADFASRLAAVGFAGDAARAARQAAWCSSGSAVSLVVLRALLTGKLRPQQRVAASP